MKIQIAKRADGAGVMRCTRPDGSVVWQKVPKHGAHFALHDLTHFAVETTLGYRRGFYGLLAEGWDFDDVTGKGARGPLPQEALEVERVVGVFDSERMCGARYSVEDFNSFAPREFTADEIDAVRRRRGELFRQWGDTAVGQNLELALER